MPSSRLLLSLSLLAFAACSSKVTTTIDQEAQNKIDTARNCVPPQLAKLDELMTFVDLWRLNGTEDPPDPSGLSWTENGSGVIDYTINAGSFTIAGSIAFYSPTGVPYDATLTPAPGGSLSQAIDDAATEMRGAFATGRPFMVGSWTISGTGVSGSGAFTGLIAGATNGNELEELRTTTTTVTTGPPDVADASITTTGSEVCVFTFRLPGLLTDQTPTQDYPEGTMTFSLENQTTSTTIAGSLVFDATSEARLMVTGFTGYFPVNLDTFTVGTLVP